MLSIAVIEDNAAYAAMLKGYILREPSFRGQVSVDLYLNPGGFLEGMEKGRQYGLCFSDIEMPGMNGIETFERMQKFSVKIPVIFLTASGDKDDVMSAIKLGAVNYLKKPFLPQELLKRVAKEFEGK